MNEKCCTAVLVVGLAAVSSVACSDSLPTEETQSQPVRFGLSELSARAIEDALDDARDRILPAFKTDGAAHALQHALNELDVSIAERDAQRLQHALVLMESATGTSGHWNDAPELMVELDVLRLLMNQVRSLTGRETRTNQP